MFEIGEDGFPSILPQRVGERDAGVSQERVMHSTVGSYSGIRTVEHENHDKSITSLRTRNGWPVFETDGETSKYVEPTYCFQGFPASQHVVYGVKVSGASYVAADYGDPELWHFGGKKVVPFSALKTTLIDANTDWYDTTGVVEGVVTWRSIRSLGRNNGSSFINEGREAAYYRGAGYNHPFVYNFPPNDIYPNFVDIVPCDAFLRRMYGDFDSTRYPEDIKVHLDGKPFDVKVNDNLYTLLCAAKHANGKLRAILALRGGVFKTENVSGGSSDPELTPESPRCYPPKEYFVFSTLYMIEQGEDGDVFTDGWNKISEINILPTTTGTTFPYIYPERDANDLPIEGNGYVSFLQIPLFNSSATKAVGIMTENYPKWVPGAKYSGFGNGTPDRAAARDWVFEIDFEAGTLTKLEVATYFEGSYYQRPPADPGYARVDNTYRVLAVDYVGDTIKYLRFSTSYFIESITNASSVYKVVHSYYTDNFRYSWGEEQTSAPGDTYNPIPIGTPLTIHSYDLRNDFACYHYGYGLTTVPIEGGFNKIPNAGVDDNDHVAAVTTKTSHRYMSFGFGGTFPEISHQYFGENIRFVTSYPGEQIAVYSYAMAGQTPIGRARLVKGDDQTDLLPLITKVQYQNAPDGVPGLFCPLFYRKE